MNKKWLNILNDLADKAPLPKQVIVERPRKRRGFVKGAAIGTALGGLAALLFAPKSGKDTRKEVQKQAKSLQGEATKRAGDLTKKVQQRVDVAQNRATKTARDTARKAAQTATSVQRSAETSIDKAAKGAKRGTRRAARTTRKTANRVSRPSADR